MAGRKGRVFSDAPVRGAARGSGRARCRVTPSSSRLACLKRVDTHETHNVESQRWRNSLKVRCFGVDLLGIV
jgi:hypothetical protein